MFQHDSGTAMLVQIKVSTYPLIFSLMSTPTPRMNASWRWHCIMHWALNLCVLIGTFQCTCGLALWTGVFFTANYFVWDIEQFPVSRSLTLLYCRSFSESLHITFGIDFFKGSMPGNSATDWPQQPFPINAAVTRLSCLTLGSVIRLHLSFCSTWIRCVISVKNTASCHESCRSCVLLHKTRADNSWHNDFTIHHTVMSTTFLFINFSYP